MEKLPIIVIPDAQQQPFIEQAELMLRKNKELYVISSKFRSLLRSEFGLEKPSERLERWYTLTFAAFMAELSKKKISASLRQKSEWMDHFEKQQTIAAELSSIIDATDRDIDSMVYALYGLTTDEISVVEASVQ